MPTPEIARNFVSDLGAIFQGIGSILQAGAIAWAACLASDTFKNWRKQRLTERRIDQAERILCVAYEVRESLHFIRNPMILSGELKRAEEKLKQEKLWPVDESKQLRTATAQVYFDRINATVSSRQKLVDCVPMARALFGEELEKALRGLHKHANTVGVYAEAKSQEGSHESPQLRRTIEETLWEGYHVTGMDVEINEQMVLIETVCLPQLRVEL